MPLLIQANLGRGYAKALFMSNVERLDAEAGLTSVLCFNEIDEADTLDEHETLLALLTRFVWACFATREPIALGRKWTVHGRQVTHGAKGLARLSPARTISEAMASYDGLPVVFLALHYPRRHPLLLLRWRALRRAHKARIAYWLDQGVTVIWMSDVNRVRFGSLHPRERTLAHQGLDWIRVIEAPGGTQVWLQEAGVIDLSIDGHNAPWARVKLVPGKHRAH